MDRERRAHLRRWGLLGVVLLGLAGAAALLWGPLQIPGGGWLQPRVADVSKRVPPFSAEQRSAPEHAVSPSPGLDPLFGAMAMQRPITAPEAVDFTLPDLEGRPIRLREFRGKFVLLNFWATWCGPCQQEMPSLERLYDIFKQTDFTLLAVSIDRQGAQVAKPFVEDLKLTFPVVFDRTAEVSRQYGVRGLPTTYLLDPDGRIIGAAVGGRDWSRTEAKALIATLLRQASTPKRESVLSHQ